MSRWKLVFIFVVFICCFMTSTAARTGDVTADNSITGASTTSTTFDPVELSNGNVVLVNKDWGGGLGEFSAGFGGGGGVGNDVYE